MTLKELQNNLEIVLKTFEGKELNPIQQLAKDTLTGSFNAIGQLTKIIEEKEEQLSVSYRNEIKLNAEVRKLKKELSEITKDFNNNLELVNELKEKNSKLMDEAQI